jgi:hypothetical protein
MMVVCEFREAKLASDGWVRSAILSSLAGSCWIMLQMISGISGWAVRLAPQYAS